MKNNPKTVPTPTNQLVSINVMRGKEKKLSRFFGNRPSQEQLHIQSESASKHTSGSTPLRKRSISAPTSPVSFRQRKDKLHNFFGLVPNAVNSSQGT